MPEHELINPLKVENWNNLLLNMPDYSFFHTANWANVLSQSYKYKPFYICNTEKDLLCGLFPLMEVNSFLTGKNGVCLPFSDECNPIAQTTQHLQGIFEQAVALGKKQGWKYLEIRGGEQIFSSEKPSQTFIMHMLDLNMSVEQLFSNLRSSTRRNIKKAQKENVKVIVSTSYADLKEFYRLNAITRKKHGLPPQPLTFFNNLYNQVLSKDLGFISMAKINNTAISANIYFNFGQKVIFKYGASDTRWHHLRANNLTMWKAIQWCHEKGFQTMSFGRTEPESAGLMQYKAGWGAKLYQVNYYRYMLHKNCFMANAPGIHPIFKRVFSKLPIPVLKALGGILYRHMG